MPISSRTTPAPGCCEAAMKIKTEISDDEAMHINRLIDLANLREESANTHGRLDIKTLAAMLLQDVALALRRPGSWEGANMARVLEAHGYSF
jgi:hypothetical protein